MTGEEANLPFGDPLSKQSDHTIVIKAIRWDKAAAKSKVLCRLKPDVPGAELHLLEEKAPGMLASLALQGLCGLGQAFKYPFTLVFWSDVKFSSKTNSSQASVDQKGTH